MKFWKWTLSFALGLGLAACGSSGPTSQPQPTVPSSGYPAPLATQAGYPPPGPTVPGYPAPGGQATVTGSAPIVVTYKDFEIVPAQITIPAGTTVVFRIESASGVRHRPYNSEAPNIFEAPDDLGDGASWSYTFAEPGTVTLRCRYHAEMVATITVTP